MTSYIAIVHKDPDSDYGVSFPDVPGCITAGATLEEARDLAHEALALHLESLAEHKEPLPKARALDEVAADQDCQDGVAFLVIEVPDKPSPPVRVNILVPAEDLKAIDAYAEANGYTRSGFLVQAAKKAMKRRSAA